MRLYTSIFVILVSTSCVGKKKYLSLQKMHEAKQAEVSRCYDEKGTLQQEVNVKNDKIKSLEAQLNDCKTLRDKQLDQVGDLAVLSKSANDNINKTLAQLEQKDKYIKYLQSARSKSDSINLALAFNLKGVLKDGLDDKDVNIEVDKTVVMINLSDKMLYETGSAQLTTRAEEVLGKIAQIISTKPDLEVMVEGYTDNAPISTSCIKDNWDLSVQRATSVVRVLQEKYNVNPNKLIAAGRGEYNALSTNTTDAGRSMNRRTRIILMPKLGQFYDLLDPSKQ